MSDLVTTSKFDALGNPVLLGKSYGYSNQKSGFATTVVGEAIKETAKGITLRIIRRRNFLYGDPIDWNHATAEKVSVQAAILFPVEQS